MTAAVALAEAASLAAVLLGAARSEDFLDVDEVLVAGVFEARLVAEVVVAVGHAEAADVDVSDHVGGVVEILRGGDGREGRCRSAGALRSRH